MNRQLLEAASWRIVSELIRRHPDRFKLIETHPGGGTYDCLSLHSKSTAKLFHIADFNRPGSFHVFHRFGHDNDPEHIESFEIWQRMMRTDNMKDVLDDVCSRIGLKPRKVPPSTPEVLVYRFIAAFLSHAVFGREEWECRNGFFDSSGYSDCSVRSEFEQFPGAQERLQVRLDDDLLGEAAYRFWFLLKNGKPKVCFETSGWAWTKNGKCFDLASLYANDRRIWPLVIKVAGGHLR